MTDFEIVRQRLASQYLAAERLNAPGKVVARLGAVQSQDYAGAKWALAQRMTAATDAGLDRAFDDGEILRTHVLRPTWHFVTPADIRWLLELTAPRVHATNMSMYRRLELSEPIFKKTRALLEKNLEGGKHKTRAELATVLERNGIPTQDGVRLSLLMMRAELDGVVCSGARKGKQFTYALLEERAPQAGKLTRDEALVELTKRYFSTRGPATLQDFVWWSSLTMTDARKGLEMCQSELARERAGEATYWFPTSARPAGDQRPVAHLLPNYDEFFIGYKDRSAFRERIKTVTPEQITRSLYVHIVFIGGQIVGGWRRTLTKEGVNVELDLLVPLARSERRAVEGAAQKFADFLGRPLNLAEKAFEGKRDIGLFT